MRHQFRSSKGFTLVELLVTIAILALLAALLFPALSAGKHKAKRTTCLNNLHQISLGVRMYCDDSSDTPPALAAAALETNILCLWRTRPPLPGPGTTRCAVPNTMMRKASSALSTATSPSSESIGTRPNSMPAFATLPPATIIHGVRTE